MRLNRGVSLLVLAPVAAYAHPVGGHPVLHALEWRLDDGETRVRYDVEVPAAFLSGASPEAVQTELGGALKLEIDGQRVPLEPLSQEAKPTDHGGWFTLTFTAPLPAGTHDLELSNGNLPDTTGLHRTTMLVGPAVDVLASSLLVEHDGAVVRSDSGRTRNGAAARVTTAQVQTPTNALERAHHALQARPVRDPGEALLQPLYRQNRTTLAMALAAPLLGLLGAPAPRRPNPAVWAGLAAVLIADLATPAGLSVPLAIGALAAALAALRWPDALWLVAPLLAASLDVRGLSIPVIAVQAAVAGRLERAPVAIASGALLGFAQIVRASAPW
ncbi:MAG: hypothetical protein H6737_07890 [Alphaproteobacteria bacterium]|nr:hypothetical protein [Alphaproteobacteria bacterium]